MPFDQFRESYPLNFLRRQLCHFGLNPNDWQLRAEPINDYLHVEMVHKTDHDFRFNAALDHSAGGELRLNHLTLESL